MYAARTRFIPSSVASHFELTTWPPVDRAGQSGKHPAAATVDLGARMRGMWRRTGS
jgi:DNA helicase-2/ATP-dependent DNA helicase PcrA